MELELQQMREQRSGTIVNCCLRLRGLIGGNQRGTYHAAQTRCHRIH